MTLKYFKQELKKNNIPFFEDYVLAKFSTFKVGGKASIFISICHIKDLIFIQKKILEMNIP